MKGCLAIFLQEKLEEKLQDETDSFLPEKVLSPCGVVQVDLLASDQDRVTMG